MLQKLGADQLRLIATARGFLRAQAEQGVDVAEHPECYLSGWSNVPGNARLRALAHEPGATALIAGRRALDALNVMRHADWLLLNDSPPSRGMDQIVVTWCRGADFTADGEFR